MSEKIRVIIIDIITTTATVGIELFRKIYKRGKGEK